MSDTPISTRLSRRDWLGLASRGAAGVVVSQSLSGARPLVLPPSDESCVLTAALTEGPYFVDEKLHRSDIRGDVATGGRSAGVPLSLTFNVSRVAGNACTPLTGAYLDVWHCDAGGVYSDVSAGPPGPPPRMRRGERPMAPPPGGPPSDGERGGPPGGVRNAPSKDGKKFLRGYQITDAHGQAKFATIYPGWYQGRAVHVHFKLRLFAGATTTYEFTSQFFFDETLTSAVHATAPYDAKGTRDTRNTTDGIFQSLSAAEKRVLTLRASKAPNGYAGVIDLGVRVG